MKTAIVSWHLVLYLAATGFVAGESERLYGDEHQPENTHVVRVVGVDLYD